MKQTKKNSYRFSRSKYMGDTSCMLMLPRAWVRFSLRELGSVGPFQTEFSANTIDTTKSKKLFKEEYLYDIKYDEKRQDCYYIWGNGQKVYARALREGRHWFEVKYYFWETEEIIKQVMVRTNEKLVNWFQLVRK